jgi:hypothetical protein
MERHWLCSPVGIHTQGFSSTVQESVLDWALGSDCLPASAGVGTIGDTIGITTEESSTTTTHTFRIAGPSSIVIVLIRVERSSIMARIFMAEVLAGVRAFTAPTRPTFREKYIPAPSAGSIMAEMRELTPSEDSPALAAFTAAQAFTEAVSAVEVSTAGVAEASTEEAGMEAEATDRSNEVIKTMKRETINMINWWQDSSGRTRAAMVPFAILAIWVTNGAYPSLAQQSAQPTFQSTAEASQALFQAVQSNNEEAIAKILGGPTELTSSRDAGQNKVERELFAQKYQEMHRLGRDADGSVTLYIGAENWPFPVPLVAPNGAWRFDPDAGAKEVTFRRIGDNEFTAIATCHEFVDAERRYSTAPNTTNPPDISPGSLVAKAATGSTGADPVLQHGYYFRILSMPGTDGQRTGRFALIAYPAEYRFSGVMTFVVMANDVVYEKDLGPNTSALASAMAAFHKDATWRVTDE